MSTQSTESEEGDEPSVEALVTTLERAASAHEQACERVEEAGEARLEALREHYEEMTGLLDRYEARATSDGETDDDQSDAAGTDDDDASDDRDDPLDVDREPWL